VGLFFSFFLLWCRTSNTNAECPGIPRYEVIWTTNAVTVVSLSWRAKRISIRGNTNPYKPHGERNSASHAHVRLYQLNSQSEVRSNHVVESSLLICGATRFHKARTGVGGACCCLLYCLPQRGDSQLATEGEETAKASASERFGGWERGVLRGARRNGQLGQFTCGVAGKLQTTTTFQTKPIVVASLSLLRWP
jgi:hypothetical protein